MMGRQLRRLDERHVVKREYRQVETFHGDAEPFAWIQRKSGITPDRFNDEKIRQRCEELEVQIGLSETVRSNIALLKKVAGSGGSNSLNAEDEV